MKPQYGERVYAIVTNEKNPKADNWDYELSIVAGTVIRGSIPYCSVAVSWTLLGPKIKRGGACTVHSQRVFDGTEAGLQQCLSVCKRGLVSAGKRARGEYSRVVVPIKKKLLVNRHNVVRICAVVASKLHSDKLWKSKP